MCNANQRMLHQRASEYLDASGTQESRIRLLLEYMETEFLI